jgi:hypothetical protein
MYRIVCVADINVPTVIWKGPLGRKYEVTILSRNGHFEALKSISRFYKLRNYCVDCEKAFFKERDHDNNCKVIIFHGAIKSFNFRPNVTTVVEFNMGNAHLMQALKSNVCRVAASIRIESAMNGIKSLNATTTSDVQNANAIIALKIAKFMYAERCSARPVTYKGRLLWG